MIYKMVVPQSPITKEEFIAIMMLYGIPKEEAEEYAKCFNFERGEE